MQPVFISEPAKRFAEIMGMEQKAGKVTLKGLPIELLPFSQVSQEPAVESTDFNKELANPWKRDHDLAIEIAATSNTLLQLRHYHGSIVQVCLLQPDLQYYRFKILPQSLLLKQGGHLGPKYNQIRIHSTKERFRQETCHLLTQRT